MGNPIPPNIIRVAIQHCKPYKSRIPGWYKLPVKVEKPALQKADTAWKIAKNILFGIREGERSRISHHKIQAPIASTIIVVKSV